MEEKILNPGGDPKTQAQSPEMCYITLHDLMTMLMEEYILNLGGDAKTQAQSPEEYNMT